MRFAIPSFVVLSAMSLVASGPLDARSGKLRRDSFFHQSVDNVTVTDKREVGSSHGYAAISHDIAASPLEKRDAGKINIEYMGLASVAKATGSTSYTRNLY